MRKIIFSCVIITLISVTLPFLYGLIIRHTLDQHLNHIAIKSQLKVKVNRYQLGWRYSHADISLKLTNPKWLQAWQAYQQQHGIKPTDLNFHLLLRIANGPFLYHDQQWQLGQAFIQWKLMLNPIQKQTFSKLGGTLPILKGQLFAKDEKHWQLIVKVARVRLQTAASKIAVKLITLQASRHDDKQQLSLMIPKVYVNTTGHELNLKQLNLKTEMQHTQQAGWIVSPLTLTLKQFNQKASKTLTTISSGKLQFLQQFKDKGFNSQIALSANKIQIKPYQFHHFHSVLVGQQLAAKSWLALQHDLPHWANNMISFIGNQSTITLKLNSYTHKKQRLTVNADVKTPQLPAISDKSDIGALLSLNYLKKYSRFSLNAVIPKLILNNLLTYQFKERLRLTSPLANQTEITNQALEQTHSLITTWENKQWIKPQQKSYVLSISNEKTPM